MGLTQVNELAPRHILSGWITHSWLIQFNPGFHAAENAEPLNRHRAAWTNLETQRR
jgi:hypothetical protein